MQYGYNSIKHTAIMWSLIPYMTSNMSPSGVSVQLWQIPWLTCPTGSYLWIREHTPPHLSDVIYTQRSFLVGCFKSWEAALSWGPFYLHSLNLLPAWISNYIHYKECECGIITLTHSQTSTVQPLKFGNGLVISFQTLLDMWLFIHAGIQVKSC